MMHDVLRQRSVNPSSGSAQDPIQWPGCRQHAVYGKGGAKRVKRRGWSHLLVLVMVKEASEEVSPEADILQEG
jgi:hypothetical protein